MATKGQLDDATLVTAPDVITVVQSDLLIPGRGEPLRPGTVVIAESKIKFVGRPDEIPAEYRSITPFHVPVLMPGLWDCHVHYFAMDMGTSVSAGLAKYLPGYNALAGAITVADLEATLMAGFTSVRELQGYGGDLRPGIESGALVGPNIYSSIAAMSVTGGHADSHNIPIETILRYARCGGPCSIVDGPDECRKEVRTLIRRGARVIKVCSSGGVLSLNDDPEDREFSDAELRAIVEEAGLSRRVVAAHAIGKAGIMASLRAGVKTIEHGFYLDEEVADEMIKQKAILVPTRHIIETIAAHPDELPPPSKKKALKLIGTARESYKLAIQKGVRIALGTDTMSSDRKKPQAHGNNARELYWAVKMGMTPLQAIEAGTANGPETLGGMAPLSGQIKEGYDADLIAVASSPLEDIEVLTVKENITHIWKGGKLFKGKTA
ncbi:uncharacterized protein TRIVIDRAFT_42415 [Trichoderma virens Gv29-8]|uniref:Amidohydrolase-related domain-containing protein n=1 Tax=Hypocrea virens (strain Gv29-8 / FGSC 10586) TaxID=413071 RepID=G9N8H9_HYPVG|nr:uncharacterized protein TRIVIDRAFT_42415 [Trichoderma virens Gv29-8]EHK17286.1 hypothetical protein TRIVIDRAFT_42415 [Trichoderma virens Gv29-8]UKZ55705.1 hypothetical protein TrVGV298_009529 [Trichoderma virens]